MELPVIELTLDDLELDRVEAIAFVDNPAIQRNWMAFNSQEFLSPSSGESEDDFMKRCVPYVMNEGKDQDQAVAICMAKYQEMAGEKVSFDYDDTLTTAEGKAKAKELIDAGAEVYIISARSTKEAMLSTADELGIPHDKVFATGSNEEKVAKVKELGITKHYDNNPDVVSQLGGVGVKFSFYKFQTHDEEKKIVAGPLMVADMPIYRNYEGKEFFVKFSAQTIEQIVNKFMAEGRINEFNKMHNENDKLKDVFLQQSFIIDSTKGINTPNGFETLPDGSWFGYVKVNNDEIWNNYIKSGQLNGFSVEGVFSEKKKFNSNNIMTKVEQFLEKLNAKFFSEPDAANTPVEMGSAKLTDGTEIKWEGELAEGVAIMLADGSPAPDGEHTLEDGTVVAVQGGVVVAIRMPEEVAPATEDMAKMSAEIEALKLENATLKSALDGYASKEAMSSEIAKVVETQKELFELVKAFGETKTEEARKDQFRAAEHNLSTREQILAERFKNNIKRK